jgi:hypothetical protein
MSLLITSSVPESLLLETLAESFTAIEMPGESISTSKSATIIASPGTGFEQGTDEREETPLIVAVAVMIVIFSAIFAGLLFKEHKRHTQMADEAQKKKPKPVNSPANQIR